MPSNEDAKPDIPAVPQGPATTLPASSSNHPTAANSSGTVSAGSEAEPLTPEGNSLTTAITVLPQSEKQQTVTTVRTVVPKAPPKRVRLGAALRKQGIDEHAVAQGYADVMDELKSKPKDNNSGKLLVDVLKQCGKILEEEDAPKPGSNMASVPVVVVHNVPRPKRSPGPSGDKSGSNS